MAYCVTFYIFACQEPGRMNNPLKSRIPDPAFPLLFLMRISHPELVYVIAIPNIVFFPNIPHSCQNFGESRFLDSSQIPYPIIARIPQGILVKSRGIPGSRSRPWSMDILSVSKTTCLLRDFVRS